MYHDGQAALNSRAQVYSTPACGQLVWCHKVSELKQSLVNKVLHKRNRQQYYDNLLHFMYAAIKST